MAFTGIALDFSPTMKLDCKDYEPYYVQPIPHPLLLKIQTLLAPASPWHVSSDKDQPSTGSITLLRESPYESPISPLEPIQVENNKRCVSLNILCNPLFQNRAIKKRSTNLS